jgi:hypothetical protein
MTRADTVFGTCKAEELGEDKWRALWPDAEGMEWSADLGTYGDAVRLVAERRMAVCGSMTCGTRMRHG